MRFPVRSLATASLRRLNPRLPRPRFAAAMLAVVGVATPATVEATAIWTGAAGSSWSDPENWSPMQVPNAEAVEIANGDTVHLNDTEAFIGAISVGPFDQAGSGGALVVSTAAAGLTSHGAFIAEGPGSTASIMVSDLATWTDMGLGMSIGYRGDGRVEITRGGEFTRESSTTFSDYSLFIGGLAGSSGTLVIDQGQFTHTGGRGIIVGSEGMGTVEVRNGSTVQNNGYLEIGYLSDAHNSVLIDNSMWTNTADVHVGLGGVGTLTLQNDAEFSARSSNVNGSSTAIVDKAAWNSTFFSSRGTLEVKQGGVISSDVIFISDGQTTVDGAFLVARDRLTVRGPGVVNVASGVVHVSNASELQTPVGTGALVGNTTGLGELWVESGGSLYFPAGSAGAIDGLEGTRASVTGAGSRWVVDALGIGTINHGQMSIVGGASVVPAGQTTLFVNIGVEATANGALHVSGKTPAGVPSLLETGNLNVGRYGYGSLTVADGANVVSKQGSIGIFASTNFLGGEATVTGTGSLWSISDELFIGGANTGSLVIRNGGRVEVGSLPTSTSVVVGAETNPMLGPATLTVEGDGSELKVLGVLTVGDRGAGEMRIRNQGYVDNDAAWIGKGANSQGKVLVDNASWLVRDRLTIGELGTAELDVRNSGIVVAKNGVLIGPDGTLLGTGGITGDGVTILVENEGMAKPGTSPGTFTIDGNYKQGPLGLLQIELASPTNFDVLNVTGQAMLGGALDVVLLDGFTPGPSDSFEFLKASSFTGAFDSVTVRTPTGPAGSFTIMPTSTGLSLSDYEGGGQSTGGPIAYWNAENGAADVTGNGHDGTFVGDVTTVADGPFGNAFAFDGNGDYIDIGDELDMEDSDYTLAAWINGDPAMQQWGRIFDKGYFTGYSLHRRQTSNQIGYESLNSGNFFGTSSTLIDNAWHHVALVKEGITVTIYADGEAENSHTISGAVQSNSLPLLIGYNPGEGIRGFWKGLLDELKIFNRALSPSEIALLALQEAELAGDYNDDGIVNAADYIVWRNHNGTAFELPNRDPASSGNIGPADYDVWVASFGRTAARASLGHTTVPEPGTMGLTCFVGGLAVAALRRR